MTEAKDELFGRLEDILADELYIGETSADLNKEANTNLWVIGCSPEMCEELSVDDVLQFLETIIDHRRKEIQRLAPGQGMLFYVWHDEQAGQLRFSLVSKVHGRLPFACTVRRVDDPAEIVRSFLQSGCVAETCAEGDKAEAKDEFVEVAFAGGEAPEEVFVLDVYAIQLK